MRILDERTLLLERPGNRIADTLVNLLDDPRIALLFLIPGVTESFRVNGRATLTHDAALLASSALEGKAPKLGILVDIDEAYTQCSKASLRAGLWDPSRFRAPTDVPTSGAIFRELLGANSTPPPTTPSVPNATNAAKASTERRSRSRQRAH